MGHKAVKVGTTVGKPALTSSWCHSWGQFPAVNRTASRPESNEASIAFDPLVIPFGIFRSLGERTSGLKP